MSPKERRAYALGHRFSLRKARRELDEMGRRLDDELAGLDDKMRAAREQVARSIDDELDGLADEMRGMRNEFYRLKAIEEAEALKLAINEASRSNGSVNVSLLLGIANELARRR